MRISDWSSDVCSSDLMATMSGGRHLLLFAGRGIFLVGLGAFGSRRTHAAGFDRRDKKARLGPILGRMRERSRNRSGCKEKGQQEEDYPSHWNRPLASK